MSKFVKIGDNLVNLDLVTCISKIDDNEIEIFFVNNDGPLTIDDINYNNVVKTVTSPIPSKVEAATNEEVDDKSEFQKLFGG